MAYTEQEKEQWLEIAQDTGESLERSIPILPLNEMNKTVSIPGVVFPNIIIDETTGEVTSLGKPSGYAQLPLGTLVIKTKAASDAADAANAASTLANTKAELADAAATLANTKAQYAQEEGNYAKAQGDYAKEWNDHPPYIGNDNYWYIWDAANDVYRKSAYAKGDDLHWEEMTEAEKEALAQRVLAELVFASVSTCEDIIDELT